MTQTLTKNEQYEAAFRALKEQRSGSEPHWLADLREVGMERFLHYGFPVERKGNEPWKYTDVRPIAAGEFDYPLERANVSNEEIEKLAPFDAGMIRLVLVDGHFSPELSSGQETSEVTVMPLSEAVTKHGDLVQANFGRHAEPNHDAFVGLSTALFADGVFVHATGPTKTPVHLLYVTSGEGRPVTFPRALVVASPLSELSLIETYVSLGEGNHFTDAVTELLVDDGAKVDHYRLMLENTAAYHVGHVRVVQRRDTDYANLAYETGTGLGRLDLHSLFDEPGSSSRLRGLYITAGDQHIDNVVTIDHAKPHNTSRLYYKGILDERSSAVFGGTVFVRPGADKTDAHQEDKNMLLSREAEVDSKPALEIYADDVKAGHGATAGAIATESLFYLQSRGIDEFTAMKMLVRGFASEIIDTVNIAPLREWLEQNTDTAIPRFRQGK